MIAVTEETGLATTLNWPKDTVSVKPDKLGASFSYLRNDYSLPGISTTVIHQNKTPTSSSNLLEKGSYFDFMLF